MINTCVCTVHSSIFTLVSNCSTRPHNVLCNYGNTAVHEYMYEYLQAYFLCYNLVPIFVSVGGIQRV